MTPISLAVYHDRLNALPVLVKHKANSSWSNEIKPSERDDTKKLRAELNDILQMSAVFASVQAMEVLSSSDQEPVPYDPGRIWHLFRTMRVQHTGNTEPSMVRAAEKALDELLRKKGIPLAKVEAIGSKDIEDDFVHIVARVRNDTDVTVSCKITSADDCEEVLVDALEIHA